MIAVGAAIAVYAGRVVAATHAAAAALMAAVNVEARVRRVDVRVVDALARVAVTIAACSSWTRTQFSVQNASKPTLANKFASLDRWRPFLLNEAGTAALAIVATSMQALAARRRCFGRRLTCCARRGISTWTAEDRKCRTSSRGRCKWSTKLFQPALVTRQAKLRRAQSCTRVVEKSRDS